MNGNPWTTEEEAIMLELRKQGHTNAYISQQLGRGINSVLAHDRDIKRRKGTYDPKPKHRWTVRDIAEMKRMESEGYAVWAIAEKLGVTRTAIYQKRRELKRDERRT